MSKVKIQGNASGTGVVTLTAPNTNTDRTITLPDSTGTLATTADTTDLDGAITINESGADVDFRVESDTLTHALFVQGSDGNIGINDSTPNKKLVVKDSDGLAVERTTDIDQTRLVWKGIEQYSNSSSSHDDLTIKFVNNSATVTNLTLKGDGRGLSQFTAKAWVNFNGRGTVSIRDSHNVSSITDNTSGDFTINYSNNMANTNYSLTGTSGHGEASIQADSYCGFSLYHGGLSVSSGRFRTPRWSTANQFLDPSEVCAIVFGD